MRKPMLEFPVRIALTDKGVRFFLRNRRRISQVRLSDGSLESGSIMQPVNAQALQGMICRAYVSTVEVARSEFRTRRNELIDLNKLIVYAVLYERFANHVHRFLLGSDFVDRWNREHPRNPIDARSRFSELPVEEFLGKHEPLQRRVAGVILARMEAGLGPAGPRFRRGGERCADEHWPSISQPPAPLHVVPPAGVQRNRPSRGLAGKDRKAPGQVREESGRRGLPLFHHHGNGRLRGERQTAGDGAPALPGRGIPGLEDDEGLRSQVRTHLESHKDFLYLTWRIRHGDLPRAVRPALQVDLINKCYDFHFLKAQMDSRKRIDVRERSLADFYEQLPESHSDGDFGQYYLSYLEQACTHFRMPFESRRSHLGPET